MPVAAELAFRRNQWRELLRRGGPHDVPPRVLRDLRMYGSTSGIWQDDTRTFPLSADGSGATVSIFRAGSSHPDDLSPTELIWNYPSTARNGRDWAEVSATKTAGRLDLPVFVITPGTRGNLHNVQVGRVESWDDERRVFRILLRDDLDDRPSTLIDDATLGQIGAPYRRPDEDVASAARAPFEVDPDKIDRGLRGHRRTQNLLSEWVKGQGLVPLSPSVGTPDYDLAWVQEGRTFVVEVKSLSGANETRQLRLGLGQVLDYDDLMSSGQPVQPVLAVEREPADSRWLNICERHGVSLVWPESFDRLAAPSRT